MSNYLLTLKVNELDSQLQTLSLYTHDATFIAGLPNPLNNNMLCTDSGGTSYNIVGAKGITGQTITTSGPANFNSAVVTNNLACGSLVASQPITAGGGIKSNSILSTGAGQIITVSSPASFLQPITTGAITAQGLITASNGLTANTSTVNGNLFVNGNISGISGGNVTFSSGIQMNGNTILQPNITNAPAISCSGNIQSSTLSLSTGITTPIITTDTIEAKTAGVVSCTEMRLSTVDISNLSPYSLGENIEVSGVLNSNSDINTTGNISATGSITAGSLSVSDLNLTSINQTAQSSTLEIFSPLQCDKGIVISGIRGISGTLPDPNASQYNITNVQNLNCNSTLSDYTNCNVIGSNPLGIYPPNPNNNVYMQANMMSSNRQTPATNYSISEVSSLGLRPSGQEFNGQNTLVQASPTPTVGTGCLQVSTTANGNLGAWGTVYDTVYNIPPGVGTVTLENVLTAGNTATDVGLVVPSITGNETNRTWGQPPYLLVPTDIAVLGYSTNYQSMTKESIGIADMMQPETDNFGFISLFNNKLYVQLQPGQEGPIPFSTGVWGQVYDSLYNVPASVSIATLPNYTTPAPAKITFTKNDNGCRFGSLGYFSLNDTFNYNYYTLTGLSITLGSSPVAGLDSALFWVYLSPDPTLCPTAGIPISDLGFVEVNYFNFQAVSSVQTQTYTNQILTVVVPSTSASNKVYLMLAIQGGNDSQLGTYSGFRFGCSGMSLFGQNSTTSGSGNITLNS